MQKRAIPLILIIALALALALPAIASQADFTFTLTADKDSYNVGDTVTVTLTVTHTGGDSTEQLAALQNEIFFDNSVFMYVDHAVGALGGHGGEVRDTVGTDSKFNFMFVAMDGIPIGQSTDVLTLRFEALSAGTAGLSSGNSYIMLKDMAAPEAVTDTRDIPTITITDPTNPTTPTNPGDPGGTGGGTGDTPGYSFQTGPRGEIIIDLPDSPLADLPDIHKCYAFTDIDGHWGRAAICFVIERDIFRGVSDTIFDPDGTMTRAMLVTVLHRLENTPAPREAYGFEDLTAGSWYEAAVNWAAQNGIVEGHSETVFAPYDNLTREQMVTILFRYQRFKGQNTSASGDLSGFADSGDISGWAIEGVRYGVGSGLIRGFEDDTVRPQGSATRAQVATIISRMMGLDV